MPGRRPRLPSDLITLCISSILCHACSKQTTLEGSGIGVCNNDLHDWTPVFTIDTVAEAVLTQLRDTATHFASSLVGYVLMPTHLHMLLGMPRIEHLPQFMQTFKSLSSRSAKKLLDGDRLLHLQRKGRYHLWMPRYDDLIVYSERQFKTKLEYIHNNPVKAGLVGTSTEWRYSSASAWFGGSEGLIRMNKDFRWTEDQAR